MTTTDAYINEVLERIPAHLPLHAHVAQEVRNLFAERMSHGQSFEEAARQLGDANTLAESYLSAVPLVPAPFMSRVAAKVIDWFVSSAICTLLVSTPLSIAFPGVVGVPELIIMFVFVGGIFLWLLSAVAETLYSRTPGKKLMGLYVVRESGARISFGMAIVRQLPILLQVFLIDALFALFTERKQRAFEMLSRTRTVRS